MGFKHNAFLVLAQYLGWPPRHLSVSHGDSGSLQGLELCVYLPPSSPPSSPLLPVRPSPFCPASPLGQDLLLSVALRSKLEDDVF